MELAEYQGFTDSLTESLGGRPEVLGLVALGSMALRDYAPDRHSDHDFFVVTRLGAAEALRADLSWLPDPDRISFTFRETAHGLKVLYDSGHLLELAVFEPDELALARVNRYRVLLDRADVAERLAVVAASTSAIVDKEAETDEYLIGQFLTNVLVGVGRWRRGEKLSGRSLVQSNAVRHLLVLLNRHVVSANAGLLDSLEPTRRFERVHPLLGAELDDALSLDLPESAVRLVDLAEWELRKRAPGIDVPAEAFALVRQVISPPPRERRRHPES